MRQVTVPRWTEPLSASFSPLYPQKTYIEHLTQLANVLNLHLRQKTVHCASKYKI
jgi:hypothetical protein